MGKRLSTSIWRQTFRVGKPPEPVSDEDRAKLARQAEALLSAEIRDEGSSGLRAARIDELDEDRARYGIPPLKTEPELHRLARRLGLIRR